MERRQEPRPHLHVAVTGKLRERSVGIWIEAPAGKTGRDMEKTAAHVPLSWAPTPWRWHPGSGWPGEWISQWWDKALSV